MLHPEAHLDMVRQRHSDLLRQARAGELAMRLAETRREERRSFLARLHSNNNTRRSSIPATSA
jgi:hypothetical protein